MLTSMETQQKITVEIPAALLASAQANTGTGVTATVRAGLQLLAARRAGNDLRSLRGKVRFSRSARALRLDRE